MLELVCHRQREGRRSMGESGRQTNQRTKYQKHRNNSEEKYQGSVNRVH